MRVLSIDVGIVNIGVCLYSDDKEILYLDKVSIAPSLKAMKDESEIVPRVFNLIHTKLDSYFKRADVVIIEQQMKRKMLIIQHVIGSYCFGNNIDYYFVNPRSVKKYFDIGSYKRKKLGVSVKGSKKNHKANKLMAIAKVNTMFPNLLKRYDTRKHDDICDALLQAIWFAEKGYATVN